VVRDRPETVWRMLLACWITMQEWRHTIMPIGFQCFGSSFLSWTLCYVLAKVAVLYNHFWIAQDLPERNYCVSRRRNVCIFTQILTFRRGVSGNDAKAADEFWSSCMCFLMKRTYGRTDIIRKWGDKPIHYHDKVHRWLRRSAACDAGSEKF
jgi:hypothetical protein